MAYFFTLKRTKTGRRNGLLPKPNWTTYIRSDTNVSEVAFSPRGERIAITAKDGTLLGFLSEYQEQTWGMGLRTMMSNGLTPVTKGQIHATAQSVYGEIYLDSDLDRFFGAYSSKAQPDAATLMRAQYAFDDRKKDAPVAWVLWFFLWWIGAHRFFMGQYVAGLVICAITFIGAPLLISINPVLAFLVGLAVFILEGCLIPTNLRQANAKTRKEEFSKHGVSNFA